MVTHDVQSAVGDGESLTADSKLAVDKKQQAPQSQPASLSHNAPGCEKTKNRPKAGDYDAATRWILETAIEFYHVLLLSEDPFPESHVETDWAKGAWDMSCQYYKSTDASLNPALIRLASSFLRYITARSSNLRGQFKTKARSVIATSYGFEMGDGIATRERNRDLAAELKFKSAFTFRELHPRRTGIYKNKAIQQAINEVLFKNKGDEGIKWAEYYDPFPRVAFALTLTVFECALDEWASGKRESIAFKEDSYKGIYIQHMKTLKYFHQQTEEFNILPAVLEQVYSNGR
ncbi:hypothetical protein EV363DRAFT_1168749 [Boletus edulis]|nr:hypothetical protein EV363DRAFT_1168749 [Boletus edulis]